MKIEMLTSSKNWSGGEVLDLEPAEAQALIDKGYALSLEAEKTEELPVEIPAKKGKTKAIEMPEVKEDEPA